MSDERKVIGEYLDGSPIHEHPDKREIEAHLDEWVQYVKVLGNQEHLETLHEMYNMRVMDEWKKVCKKWGAYEAVEQAVKWWFKYYPQEAQQFFPYINFRRQTLKNRMGFSAIGQYRGAMPPGIRAFIQVYEPEMLKPDKKGESRGVKLFYQIFEKAKIGGWRI